MKKGMILCLVLCMLLSLFLSGCDAISGLLGGGGGGDTTEKYNDELTRATGKWQLTEDEDTYFLLDGTAGVMSFRYVEDGADKYDGRFRATYRGLSTDVSNPLLLNLTRSDKTREDWLGCYTECFAEDFTQFTIVTEEEDLGMTDGTIYTHIYRISELPYKLGTYILEGNSYKSESDIYFGADEYRIPAGTYTADGGERFTVLYSKVHACPLFQYQNGDTVIEGSFTMAADKKTIYLYIEHDPYTKVTPADRDRYDTTFDINYPPDFYLRGNFDVTADAFSVNDLYHHTYSPTEIRDEIWVFGTYQK